MIQIIAIVEGHGDVEAAPILIRRIAEKLGKGNAVSIPRPIRCPKGKMMQEKELERILNLAAEKLTRPGGILILLDADSDCPVELAQKLLTDARKLRKDKNIFVVLAKREYETWFLAALPSLAGKRGIKPNLGFIPNVEDVSGAKERLEKEMEIRQYYSETVDQAALSGLFDLDMAKKNSPSFDKFYRTVGDILK